MLSLFRLNIKKVQGVFGFFLSFFPFFSYGQSAINFQGEHQQLDSFVFRESNAHIDLFGMNNSEIFEGKNSILIDPNTTNAQRFNNLSRSIFKIIPGMNIWEYDGTGVQLNIGTRGLSPNRSSNLNTRQNGCDISADAYGYPEAYFIPPAEAVEKINFSRGSMGLQSGPHFGGSLDFKIKESEKGKIVATEKLTLGENNFLKSFTSVGGEMNRWKYYAYYQRLQTDGFIPNSPLGQNVVYLSTKFTSKNHWNVSAQFTSMGYHTGQPGGLSDSLFKIDPYQSNRKRNWMSVNWNLYALIFNKYFNNSTSLNLRFFALDAHRKQVGRINLLPTSEDKVNIERDLKIGLFKNFGTEARLAKQYFIGSTKAQLVSGIRIYKGETRDTRGFANSENFASYDFVSANQEGNSSFVFPGNNLAFFAENIWRVTPLLSITPGLRYEIIQTQANGYFLQSTPDSSGQEILSKTKKRHSSTRNFPLFGIGINRKLGDLNFIANFTQNYRAVNFSDITVTNPNLRVDPNMRDEFGNNIDIAIRGFLKPASIYFNIGLFYLNYNNMIGSGEIANEEGKLVPYKTNIGRAFTRGIESLFQLNFKLPIPNLETNKSSIFINYSYIEGKYIEGPELYLGNQLEYLSPHILKTGLTLNFGALRLSYQYSYQNQQFSDAKNTISSSTGLAGVIPSFGIHDLFTSFHFKNFSYQVSLNNVLNKEYFTRRANGFPGPGIVSGVPRRFFMTISYRFGVPK